jgi:hypothetical protein
MMEWFMSGGQSMFVVLAIGVAAIGYSAKAVRAVTPERLAVLRALPSLILTFAAFGFGINLWAVNRALEKAAAAHTPDPSVIGLIGFTEAAQTLTFGAILAFVVAALRVAAEGKLARRAD